MNRRGPFDSAQGGPFDSAQDRHRRWRLSIARDMRDGILVFTVTGRLAAASSGELTQGLGDAIDAGTAAIVLDLSGVDYISSAGVLAIDAAAARSRLAGGEMVICGLTEPVRLAFDLAGSLPQLVIEPSWQAAVRRLTMG